MKEVSLARVSPSGDSVKVQSQGNGSEVLTSV